MITNSMERKHSQAAPFPDSPFPDQVGYNSYCYYVKNSSKKQMEKEVDDIEYIVYNNL